MNHDHPNRRIGYNPKLFINQEVARKYLCTICSKVLKDPVQIPQTADPKRACKDCYKENIRWYCTVLFSHTNLPSSNICNPEIRFFFKIFRQIVRFCYFCGNYVTTCLKPTMERLEQSVRPLQIQDTRARLILLFWCLYS